MFTNYLKIALRLIRRNKLYTTLNVVGLAVGMAVCLLLLVFVFHELNFDAFHKNGDRIYRVYTEQHDSGTDEISLPTNAVLGPELAGDYDEIVSFARFFSRNGLLRYGDDHTYDIRQLDFVDSTFLDIFSFRIVAGNKKNPLSDAHSIVLGESVAESLYPDRNPIGQTVTLDNRIPLQVTAVIEDCPSNSHLFYRALVPFHLLPEYNQDTAALSNKSNWNYSTYVMLAPHSDAASLEAKLPDFVENHIEKGIQDQFKLRLQSLHDIHLTTGLRFETAIIVSSGYLYGLTILALFILLIAGINFVNLSTARSMRRAKEVGLRKVMGADKKRLIYQFLGESILLSFLAIPLALAFVEFFMPAFGDLVGRRLDLISAATWPVIWLVPGLALLVGIGGGLYPAFFLSVARPVNILRGNYATGRSGARFRKGLIIFQFALSIVLLVSTIVVHRQIQFMVNRDPGFDRKQIVFFYANAPIIKSYDAFRSEIAAVPGVEAVARGASIPCQVGTRQTYIATVDNELDTLSMYSLIAGYGYLKTVGLHLVAGRSFDQKFGTDENEAYIINETAARKLGWGDSAVGRPLHVWSKGEGHVIGVVKDFNHNSAKSAIEPLVLRMEPSWAYCTVVRIAPGATKTVTKAIEAIYAKYSPRFPFHFNFMDEAIEWQYWSEQRLGKIFIYATALAILVACLGLYGMAHYSTEVRIREVGVRKVLGASVRSVTMMFIRDFALYVLIANVIAWPLAYFAMSKWLEEFAFRINVGIVTLLASAVIVLVTAVLTVAFRAHRAATTNPASALRYE